MGNEVLEFAAKLEAYWQKEQSPERMRAIIGRCSGFDKDRLDKIYDWLINKCQYFPQVYDVNDAVTATWEGGREQDRRDHVSCDRCGGEGLVQVIFDIDRQSHPWRKKFNSEVRLDKKPEHTYLKQGVAIARCTCKNGKRFPSTYRLITDIPGADQDDWAGYDPFGVEDVQGNLIP